jgi:hypothetical protein
MKIRHRFAPTPDEEMQEDFARVGIQLELGDVTTVFIIDDDDVRWPRVAKLAEKFRMWENTLTEFSNSELAAAKYLAIEPSWHHQYPQPDDDFGYRKITYDIASICKQCHAGKRQIAPFRMKKEPVWGRRSILQLNWVFDEYFVKPDVYEQVFKPFGIGFRPVLKHSTGMQLQTVVQLEISATADLEMGDQPSAVCPVCSIKRYSPKIVGYFPKPIVDSDSAIFRSKQWFGSGGSSFNEIFVSNALYKRITEAGLRGAEFSACAE